MLDYLFQKLNTLKYTPLHPQWIANYHHGKRLQMIESLPVSGLSLDLGSGNSQLAKYHKNIHIISLDYPDTACRYTENPDIFGDAQALPFQQESFDNIFLFEVLEHIVNDRKAISEIARIIKPDGLLFLSVPFLYPLHDLPHDFRRYTPYGIRSLLEYHGFAIIEEKSNGNSFVTVFQLFNLMILDFVRSIEPSLKFFILPVAVAAYCICLINNLLALLLMKPSSPRSLSLGCRVIAQKKEND